MVLRLIEKNIRTIREEKANHRQNAAIKMKGFKGLLNTPRNERFYDTFV